MKTIRVFDSNGKVWKVQLRKKWVGTLGKVGGLAQWRDRKAAEYDANGEPVLGKLLREAGDFEIALLFDMIEHHELVSQL